MADPAKLDRYKHVRILGTGGMGTVSLAEDTVLGREVALKRVTGAAGASGLLRLRREALVGASISHPNLVSIYDVDETEEGELVIVMEYVEGETLRDAIARDGGLGTDEALRILSGAAAGLDAIHAQGIVHRDVKPANVLLGSNRDVKVADLGIASVSDRTQITTSGAIVGSLGYMAPEQMHEAPATPAIDIYALAAVAYETLSGTKARRESNPVALAYAMENKPPPDLREVWPAAPAAAADLLERAMDRDPGRRPSSAGELVAQLDSALRSPPTTRVTRQLPPRRSPVAIPVPATAGAASVSAAARPTRASAPARPVSAFAAGSRPHSRRRTLVLLGVGLLALVVAGAIVAIVLASGSSTPSPPRTVSHHAATTPASAGRSANQTSSAASSASSTVSSSSSAASTPASVAAGPSGSPGDAAKSFYTLAAGHRYSQAWALADPAFQSQLGGYQSFQNTFSGDRSITVDSLRTLSKSASSATVAISTTSVRTDGTQHCSGTVLLSPASSGGGWLMHHIQIGCH
ncbi:MAG TPA: serine/threonine-protein kinase [Solirubrobacteraceae bacterium]